MSPSPYAILCFPTDESAETLLAPGAPVYSGRDELRGWTVAGEDGGTLVHAPTEGDGHVHPVDDAWALELWRDGARVPEGIDRLRRVIAAQGWKTRNAPPEDAWCMNPTIEGAWLLAREAADRGLCRAVALERPT